MKLRQQWLSVLLLIIMMLFKLCSILTLYSVHAASAELMEVEHEHADDRMPITSKKPRKDPCR